MKTLFSFSLTLMLVCMALVIDANSQYYVISQRCLKNGSGISGVEVTATGKSTGQTFSDWTGLDGIARISVPANQIYVVSARVEGITKLHETVGTVVGDEDMPDLVW